MASLFFSQSNRRWVVSVHHSRSRVRRKYFADKSDALAYASDNSIELRRRPPAMTDPQMRQFIAASVATDSESGCWLWSRRLQPDGYASLSWTRKGKRVVLAHRASYMVSVGEIPAGLELDHLCRVRHCVNPEHLEAVTHSVNVLRAYAASQGVSA